MKKKKAKRLKKAPKGSKTLETSEQRPENFKLPAVRLCVDLGSSLSGS